MLKRNERAEISEPPDSGVKTFAPTTIVVLGMHRSGTSAVSGLLFAAGAYVGNEHGLMPPDTANPRGYFERRVGAELLDEKLTSMGGHWSTPPWTLLQSAGQTADMARMAKFFGGLVAEAPIDASVTVAKDPRLCLFAAGVCEHLGAGGHYVLVVRHPLEVARSLEAVHGIPVHEGLALWEAYNVAALAGLRGKSLWMVNYSRAVSDPRYLTDFLRSIRKAFPQMAGSDLTSADVRASFVPSLARNAIHGSGKGYLSLAQRNLWRALERGSRRPENYLLTIQADLSPGAYSVLEQRRGIVNRAEESERLVESLRGELQAVESLRGELQAVVAERNVLAGEFAGVAQDLQGAVGRAEESERLVESLRGELQAVVAERNVLAGDRDRAIETGCEILRTLEAVRAELRNSVAASLALEEAAAVAAREHEESFTAVQAELASVGRHRDEVVEEYLTVRKSLAMRTGNVIAWPMRIWRKPNRLSGSHSDDA